MPFSTNYFKKEIKNYIVDNFRKNINILDIGAGSGTYSNLLRPLGYNNIDCVEVFENYVETYSLKSKYTNVFIEDITKFDIDFNHYDLIILGDVLEHIKQDDAIKLINKLKHIPTIIGVPFESEQGEHFGNVHETHLQSDLTLENFIIRFSGFRPLCLRFDYGIFINKNSDKIYFEVGENQLPNNFLKYIVKNYPDLEYVYLNTENKPNTITKLKENKVTIVTGLWNLGRDKISDSFKRGYDSYLERFSQLLKTDVNMYIFCDPSDESFIWEHRNKNNTVINKMTLDELLKWFNFTNITNEIRQNEDWLSQASWLKESPQATLEGYNPLVMSKMFMLNNVTIWNPFNSEYFFWIDAGITNTVHYGYFTHDKVFDKLPKFIDENDDFVFLTYPYIGGTEIHGFERNAIAKYSNTDYVKYVCRGGFFGGKKEKINIINGFYYGYLNNTLNDGYMGTEESIFSIILYNHHDIITQYIIKEDGLIWPFFEDLKNENYKIKKTGIISGNRYDINNTALYVLTYNSPEQFEKLCMSFELYDKNFLDKPKKYLINNSLDKSKFDEYDKLCEKYGFEEIHKDNIGICGGRQFIAEHSDENNFDFHFFFEDDMFFYLGEDEFCRNGFRRKIKNFYNIMLDIINIENFDFLKWNFSEFFGDNSKQWAWHNVPQDVRERLFPERPRKSENDTGKEPYLKYRNIKSHKSVPYATGEIFYCNWPQVVTKEGNKKMFINTKWAHPYEQTWMSYIYQQTVEGNINPGILLATPTEHNRFYHYSKEERREN